MCIQNILENNLDNAKMSKKKNLIYQIITTLEAKTITNKLKSNTYEQNHHNQNETNEALWHA